MDMEVKKKEQEFKGKTLDELKKLDVREFANLLGSRERRTVLRNFQEHETFVKRILEKTEKGKRSIKTHKRELIIVPELVGLKLQVYNGKDFIPFEITLEMLGHRLGEFAQTRVRAKHNKDEKKKKKK